MERICVVMKVDISKREPMQGIYYQDGGYFKPHKDYFKTSELPGNREMFAILYLNDLFRKMICTLKGFKSI